VLFRSRNISRKEYCKQLTMLTLGTLWTHSAFVLKYNVIIGLQTYSFRDKSLDDAITDMQKLGIKHIELWEGHVQPMEFQWKRGLSAEQLKKTEKVLPPGALVLI